MYNFITHKDYILFVKNNFKRIVSLMKSFKLNTQEIEQKVTKSYLSPYEQRLLSYKNYCNYNIDIDSVMQVQQIIQITQWYDTDKIKPYDINIYNEICNYNLAIVDLTEYLTSVFSSDNSSIVYIKVPKSKKQDPFSFYQYIETINGVKQWRMDCRLQELSMDLIKILLPYCTKLYKKIYKDTYHDNTFRESHSFDLINTEGDQLIRNICVLSSIYRISKILQGIIIKYHTYTFDKTKDKLLTHSDDPNQLEGYNILKDEVNCDIKNNISSLFDHHHKKSILEFSLNYLC